jgi:hypothetical protein
MMPPACEANPAALPDLLARQPAAPHSPTRPGWGLNIAVVGLILAAAVSLYCNFRPDAPSLWYSTSHDRNGHYQRSQQVAFALREANLPRLINAIHTATVWPPLHPFVTGPIMAVGGIDYRVAVLSSLAAWAAMCWLAFALAVRLAPRCKWLAGGVALLLTLASPAHRAFATDIMIESLGAALTMAALYFYVVAVDDRSAWHSRCFALTLFALFLAKSNYWTLVAAGLIPALLFRYRAPLADWFRAWRRTFSLRAWLAAQARHPLTYLLLASFGFLGYVRVFGGLTVTLAGHRVVIGSLNFPVQVCYVLLFLRVLPWWWRSGRVAAARLNPPFRQMIYWFVYPLAVWLLWPNRLGTFLWYVTYTQHGGAAEYGPWSGNFWYYWPVLGQDYHANAISAAIVVGLTAVAILGWRRWSAGGAAVFICLVVAAVLTNYHSASRGRFLHSWVAIIWVTAGVGAAWIVDRLTRLSIPNVVGPAALRLRAALAVGAVAGIAWLQGAALLQTGHAEEGGPRVTDPNLLAVADAVVPTVQAACRPGLLSDPPFQLVFDWRLSESQGAARRLLTPPRDLLTATPGPLDEWLDRTACDVVLLIDAPQRRDWTATPGFDIARLRSLLVTSGAYVLESERRFVQGSDITVQVWRRDPIAAASAAMRTADDRAERGH